MRLFEQIIDEDKLHHNFIYLKKNKYLRRVVNEWAKGFKDRDGKFVKEFQTTFNSSFWELYLNAFLQQKFLNIDFSHEAPDFIIINEEKETKYTIEATIANNAVDRPAEWEQEEKMEFMKKKLTENEIKKIRLEATVRICNSITNKFNKYKSRYEKLEYVRNKPFILALASFDSFSFYKYGMDPILRALYGIDENYYDGDDVVEKTVKSVVKSNNTAIEVGIFTNDKYKEISAILYSNTATYGKLEALSATTNKKNLFFSTMKYNQFGELPNTSIVEGKNYEESLSDGLYLFLNPYASYHLSEDEVRELSDSKTSIYYEKDKYIVEDGFLFSRETLRVKKKLE